ncbi:MAG: hypothetical protein AAFW76_04775 [Pseudomonadota bacterium]
MKLRTFVAPTAAEAMGQIRREIGDEAIIIATREHPNGGTAVTVVAEEAEPQVTADIGPAMAEEVDEEEEFFPIHTLPSRPQLVPEPEPEAEPQEPEPFSITEPDRENVAETLYAAFRTHRLPAAIGGQLMDLATAFETGDATTALAAALHQAFDFSPVEPGHLAGPIMAVGPPGSGKTQTLAKLAARSAMAGKKVTMITTDVERMGRSAPFAGFAAKLGCVLVEAPDLKTLNRAVATAVTADLVVVDTPGANHLSSYEMAYLRDSLIDGLIEPLLVVPAGMDPVEAADVAESYAAIGAQRAIVTRLDMTRRLSGLLAIGHDKLLALAQFGIGEKIKDGLRDASPKALAQALLTNNPLPDRRTGFSTVHKERATG